MIHNDVLRSIRYMLDLSDQHVIDIARLSKPDLALDKTEVQAFLSKEDEPGFVECSDAVLAHFRGPAPGQAPRPVEKRITNNIVLKKLRVAFELQDADMHQAFEEVGFPVSKPELSAFFRQADHRNYRACGDQILRNFLKGLTIMVRAG